MPRLEIVPFTSDHVPAAAALLAERQRAQRIIEPALAARYEDPAATQPEIEALFAADGASGVVALEGGGPVGFLVGTRRDVGWGPECVGRGGRDTPSASPSSRGICTPPPPHAGSRRDGRRIT